MTETVIGIDPGGTNVGVSVRVGDTPLLSSTYKRPEGMGKITWARTVVARIQEEVIKNYPDAHIGIEDVVPPQSHFKGKLSMQNPKHLISLSFVAGALVLAFPSAVIVRPGKNGSQPLDTYPDALKGRRPKTLAGVNEGSRDHERSAWDVAGYVPQYVSEDRGSGKEL